VSHASIERASTDLPLCLDSVPVIGDVSLAHHIARTWRSCSSPVQSGHRSPAAARGAAATASTTPQVVTMTTSSSLPPKCQRPSCCRHALAAHCGLPVACTLAHPRTRVHAPYLASCVIVKHLKCAEIALDRDGSGRSSGESRRDQHRIVERALPQRLRAQSQHGIRAHFRSQLSRVTWERPTRTRADCACAC
jgi:hypothetical protein